MNIDWEAIRIAICRDDVNTINEFIANGGDVNIRIPSKYVEYPSNAPLLGFAAYKRSGNIIKELLKQGADVNLADDSGSTPLHLVLEMSCKDLLSSIAVSIITTLLEAKADIYAKNKWGDNALLAACKHGSLPAMIAILNEKPDLSIKDNIGFNALHHACELDRIPYIEKLIEYGADINALTDSNLTPFDVAIEYHSSDTVKMFIEMGVNVNQTVDDKEMAPLDRAMLLKYHPEIVDMLKEAGAVNSDYVNTLQYAVLTDDADKVKVLLDNGADPNARYNSVDQYYGYTVLGVALDATISDFEASAIEEDLKRSYMAKLLIDAGADVNLTNGRGHTPMGVLANNRFQQKVALMLTEWLIAAGADINIASDDGWTPLMLACIKGHDKIVELLLKNGANPDMQNDIGSTALIIASDNNCIDCASLLIQYKANVNLQNKFGKTALMLCNDDKESKKIATLILKNKADVNLQDNEGDTALIISCRNRNSQVAKMLFKKGADPYIQNNEGKTALDMNTYNLCCLNSLFEEYVKDWHRS